jgi:hypothetical protein
MTQGPRPILRVLPSALGHGAGPLVLDEDEVKELKTWLTSSNDI